MRKIDGQDLLLRTRQLAIGIQKCCDSLEPEKKKKTDTTND
jgi:hypothetical protein